MKQQTVFNLSLFEVRLHHSPLLCPEESTV